jgi:hypothetical protein
MALKALTIIDEEFAKARELAKNRAAAGLQNEEHILAAVQTSIKSRIMDECIEIPECDGCHEYPAADRFMRQDAASLPPFKTNLCGDCVRALKEDGVSIKHIRES